MIHELTDAQVDELREALSKYNVDSIRYANSYSAIGDYKSSRANLERLLWEHADAIIERLQKAPIP